MHAHGHFTNGIPDLWRALKHTLLTQRTPTNVHFLRVDKLEKTGYLLQQGHSRVLASNQIGNTDSVKVESNYKFFVF